VSARCRPWSSGRSGGSALALLAAAFTCACAREPPPRLPSTAIHDRTASRVELVDFVISDHARAHKVRALYQEIEELMRAAQRVESKELAKVGSASLRSDSELRDSVAASREAELAALERYVQVQLEIRALTTPAEFARLDRIR
jgi:hypothetical protein